VVTVKVPNIEELALSFVKETLQIGRGYNVVVMVQQDALLNLYTWFPYSSHDNCGEVKNVVLLNQWSTEGEGKFVREGSLFQYEVRSNFHGCTIDLSTTLKGDFEDEFFSQYFLTHKITRNYINDFSDDTPVLENLITCINNLWNRESDMSFGAIPLMVEAISNSEPSFPYFVFKFSWFVRCAKPFSHLQKIFQIFSLSLWFSVADVLFLVTVVSW
jgi:hypothetical protein